MKYPQLKTEADVRRYKRTMFVRYLLRDPFFWLAVLIVAYGFTVMLANP